MPSPVHATPEQVRSMFPRASRSTLAANAGFAFQPEIVPPAETAKVQKLRTGPKQNKTELAYGLILEARKNRGEIAHYVYEGISLKWGDCMSYKPDFIVFGPGKPLLVECKGGHIWDRDLVRFKGCRAEWKNYFDFELWQKKAGEWTRIH